VPCGSLEKGSRARVGGAFQLLLIKDDGAGGCGPLKKVGGLFRDLTCEASPLNVLGEFVDGFMGIEDRDFNFCGRLSFSWR